MKSVLTAKHWQIFLFLMFAMVLGNFTVEGQSLLNTISKIIGAVILLAWPFILGLELYRYLPERIELGNTLIIINGLLIILSAIALVIISNGQEMNYSGSGLKALPVFYFIFAILHILFFPGKVLRSIELGHKASFGDYIGYGVLIWFWPIGIWFLQPKVNKVVKEQLTVEEKI